MVVPTLTIFIEAKEEYNKEQSLYEEKNEDLRKRNGSEKYMC